MIAYDIFWLLVIAFVAFVVFLTIRSVMLWYFRIPEIITLLQRIAIALEAEIAAVDAHEPPRPPSA